MIKEPLVTIVIPVRNRATLVDRTLASVAAQSQRPLSVVMVDNGSTDGTAGVLHRWCDTLTANGITATVVSEPQTGAANARNRGLQEVVTDYVMFFDSDDTMHPDHCRNVVSGLVSAGLPDIGGWPVRENRLGGIRSVGRFSRRNIMVNHLFHGCMSTVRYAVRTDVIRHVGGWCGSLRAWDDYELGIRLLIAAKTVARLPLNADTVQIYSQADSITGTGYTADPAKWEDALMRCTEVLAAAGRYDLLRWIDVRRVILAGEYRRSGRRDLSDALMSTLLSATPSLWHRVVYRMLLRWFLIVGRGVSIPARLLL